jgi:ankyrin repeat protein
MVKLLFDKGVDVNAKDKYGNTPLHQSLKEFSKGITSDEDEENMVELLLSKGAQIDVKDNQGYTPLDLALSYRKPNIVMLLLRNKGVKN